jgi:prostaglandin-H2 D-isomerase / glutathione transferase
MTQTTLTYFDTSSSRGEECRLALFLAGVPFTDERLKGADWPKRQPSTPYGALPVLSSEGHPPIAQSNAILRLIGSLHGLHPKDPWEAARHEALMGAIEDMRGRLGPTRHLADAERKRAREELAEGYLRDWAGNVQAQIEGPFVGGPDAMVADLKLFVALTPLVRGSIDYVPADVFKAFPKLGRHHEAVQSHPKVAAWYAR